jgi:hypothetical protein
VKNPLLAAVIVSVFLSCKGKTEAPVTDIRPEPISAAEVKRGNDACAAYIKQMCSCAEQLKAADATSTIAGEIAEQCKLDEGIPDAIALSLELADGSGVSRRDVLQAQQSVRQLISHCIEETAKLASRGCNSK